MRYVRCKFDCHRSMIKGTLLEKQWAFLAVCRQQLQSLPRNYIPLTNHACVTTSGRLVAIRQKWRTLHLEGKMSTRLYIIEGISLKIRTSHFPCMRQKRRKIGCDRSLIKGTLLGEQSTFRLYFNIHWRKFPVKSQLALSTRTLYTAEVSSCDRLHVKCC